jgi:hypothetical protein
MKTRPHRRQGCLLLWLLLLALPIAVQAQLRFTTNNGAITITGYTGNPTTLNIPSTTNGYPVRSIGNSAFVDLVYLSSATIPNSITNIGNGLFASCRSLTNVTIPDSVANIGISAFESCLSLTNVIIGSGVTSLGDGSFLDCPNLKAIKVDGRNSVYSDVDGVLCNKSQTTLIQCPGGKTGSYLIPSTVTNIGDLGFVYCVNLTNIIMGSNVVKISSDAFNYSSSLTAIAVDVFNPAFISVDGVLFDRSQTKLILCPETTAGSYTIPDTVTNIGSEAFFFCKNLTSVTIPNDVSSIEDFAFDSCQNLRQVTIPNSVTSIGEGAFAGCQNLKQVTIPNSVTNLGSVAFQYCHFLTNVTIGSGVTSISQSVFQSCGSLTCVTIPNSVTSIGDYAFWSCHNLAKVEIPNSVTNIGEMAFSYTALTSLTIPNSVTSISVGAFEECSSLTSVTLGSSVTSIGGSAFDSCTNLTSLDFYGDAPSADMTTFNLDGNATVYYLPGTSGWTTNFYGLPTALWFLPNPQILNPSAGFGVQPGGFGFTISWATNVSVVVEAATNLANPVWIPVSTNTLTGGTNYFSDPQWTNYPRRFYRISTQ